MDFEVVLLSHYRTRAKPPHGSKKGNSRMMIYQRATRLYADLFHHEPNFARQEEGDQYALLETALRNVVHDCKSVAEQHGTGEMQGLWAEGLRQGAKKIAFHIDRDIGK